jgi:hypothetical protein
MTGIHPPSCFNKLAPEKLYLVAVGLHDGHEAAKELPIMKKPMYVLFAIAALMLAGGRLSAHNVTLSSHHSASVMQTADDETSPTDPAGDPDGPNGPDGGPDGEGEGGPGAV